MRYLYFCIYVLYTSIAGKFGVVYKAYYTSKDNKIIGVAVKVYIRNYNFAEIILLLCS